MPVTVSGSLPGSPFICHLLRRHGHVRADLRDVQRVRAVARGRFRRWRLRVVGGAGAGDLSEAPSSLCGLTTKARPRRLRVRGAHGPRGAAAPSRAALARSGGSHAHAPACPPGGKPRVPPCCHDLVSQLKDLRVGEAAGPSPAGVSRTGLRPPRAPRPPSVRRLPPGSHPRPRPGPREAPQRGPAQRPLGGAVTPGSRQRPQRERQAGRRFPAAHQVALFRASPFGPEATLVPSFVTRGLSWAAPPGPQHLRAPTCARPAGAAACRGQWGPGSQPGFKGTALGFLARGPGTQVAASREMRAFTWRGVRASSSAKRSRRAEGAGRLRVLRL